MLNSDRASKPASVGLQTIGRRVRVLTIHNAGMHFGESLATAYRESAARLRALADDSDDAPYQRMLNEAAELYEYLADMADEEGAQLGHRQRP